MAMRYNINEDAKDTMEATAKKAVALEDEIRTLIGQVKTKIETVESLNVGGFEKTAAATLKSVNNSLEKLITPYSAATAEFQALVSNALHLDRLAGEAAGRILTD
ncbi:MAG: hypothetical protein IKL53_02275 [Lachnospiraceae bacterium]|nr:hypothetical protein [Lachnospiraceae bacterium]